MPYTTTHVLVAIILVELFREYFSNNKKFPRYYILIAAIGGILPDLEYIYQVPNLHVAYLHSLFAPLILLAIGFLILTFDIKHKEIRKRHMRLYAIFFILAAGSFVHILLDIIVKDGVVLFYPFTETLLSFNLISLIPLDRTLVLVGIDTLLLFFWIFWMEFKLKIDDYF